MELIEGTVQAWAEAITHGRAFDKERDQQRFRDAFRILVSTRKAWPQVSDFMEVLPARKELPALPAKAADPEKAKAIIAELAKTLKVSP